MSTTPSGSGPPYRPGEHTTVRAAPRRFSLHRTRTGGWWVALVAAAFVMLLLLIFVLQNGQSVRISFLGAHGNLPLGIAILLAAIAGVLIVAIPGSGRIIQLRHLAQRQQQPGPPSSTAPPTRPSTDQPTVASFKDAQATVPDDSHTSQAPG